MAFELNIVACVKSCTTYSVKTLDLNKLLNNKIDQCHDLSKIHGMLITFLLVIFTKINSIIDTRWINSRHRGEASLRKHLREHDKKQLYKEQL